MTKRVVQISCMLFLFTAVGCKEMFGPQGLPPDPLFANGKPAESKAIHGPPLAPPFSEPAPPVNRTHYVTH